MKAELKLSEFWSRSTMDSIRVSEAPDPGSIPGEATNILSANRNKNSSFFFVYYLSAIKLC